MSTYAHNFSWALGGVCLNCGVDYLSSSSGCVAPKRKRKKRSAKKSAR